MYKLHCFIEWTKNVYVKLCWCRDVCKSRYRKFSSQKTTSYTIPTGMATQYTVDNKVSSRSTWKRRNTQELWTSPSMNVCQSQWLLCHLVSTVSSLLYTDICTHIQTRTTSDKCFSYSTIFHQGKSKFFKLKWILVVAQFMWCKYSTFPCIF